MWPFSKRLTKYQARKLFEEVQSQVLITAFLKI